MSQHTPIKSFANQFKLDRTDEALGKVWVASTSVSNLVPSEGPFQFTGANTSIPLPYRISSNPVRIACLFQHRVSQIQASFRLLREHCVVVYESTC